MLAEAQRVVRARIASPETAALLAFLQASLALDPRGVGDPLSGPFDGLRSVTHGGFTVAYGVDDDDRVVGIAWIEVADQETS